MRFKWQNYASAVGIGEIINKQSGLAVRKESRQVPEARKRDAIQHLSEVLRSRSPSAHFGRKIVAQNKKESQHKQRLPRIKCMSAWPVRIDIWGD
jgi:hypothetical protein